MLKSLIGILIVGGFAAYLWQHRSELAMALAATGWHVLALVVLIAGSWFVAGLQGYIIYRSVNLSVSIQEGVLLGVAGAFGNHLPMRAGTILRALYLKQVHGLRLARFGGITGLRTLLTVASAGIMGLLGIGIVLLDGYAHMPIQLIAVFLALVLAPLVLMTIAVPKWEWLPSRIKRFAHDFADAYDELRRQPRVAAFVVCLLLAQYFLLGLRFVVSADAVGADLPVGFLMLMAPLAGLMMFAALTPGGLGLREAVIGYVSWNLGFSFEQGVFIGTVDRAVLLLMTAVCGGAAFLLLWRRLKSPRFSVPDSR